MAYISVLPKASVDILLEALVSKTSRVPTEELELSRIPLSLDSVSSTIFNLPDLYLTIRLNYNKYYKARTRRRLSLLVDKELIIVYFDIGTATE